MEVAENNKNNAEENVKEVEPGVDEEAHDFLHVEIATNSMKMDKCQCSSIQRHLQRLFCIQRPFFILYTPNHSKKMLYATPFDRKCCIQGTFKDKFERIFWIQCPLKENFAYNAL